MRDRHETLARAADGGRTMRLSYYRLGAAYDVNMALFWEDGVNSLSDRKRIGPRTREHLKRESARARFHWARAVVTLLTVLALPRSEGER